MTENELKLMTAYLKQRQLWEEAEAELQDTVKVLKMLWDSDELTDSLAVPIKKYFDEVGIRYDAK